MADPKEEEVIYSVGGGLTTPVREELERTTPASYLEFQVAESEPAPITRWKPPAPTTSEPSSKSEPPSKWKPSGPALGAEPKTPEAEPQGIGPNVAAGLGESVVPGIAAAIGSPVDVPLAVGRAAYGSLASLYGDVKAALGGEAPWEQSRERLLDIEKNMPIPKAPVATYLTKLFGEWGAPTPETPFTSVVPTNEQERIARRASQVAGQIATTTLGSKVYGMARPPPPAGVVGWPSLPPSTITPMVKAPDRAAGAANLALAAPTTLASAPPITSGVVAGGASATGQYAAERAKEAGVSPETAALIEKGTTLATGLPLGLGMAGARAAGEATGVNQLGRKFSVIPLQEYGASGAFGPWTRQRSEQQLAGRAFTKSPIERLAREGDWDESTADIGRTLRTQEADLKAGNEALRAAEQAAVDARLGSMGDQIAGLASRRDNQQSILSGDLGYWNIAPEAAGKTIRSGLAGGIVKKEGPLAGLTDKDAKGKPLVPDSALPDAIFNAKMTPENFTSMFHQAKAPFFREAYQSTVLSKFLNATGIKDADGNVVGIDLAKAGKWQETHKAALEASERKMRDVWGEDQRVKYSVKDRIDAAVAKQEAINDLNLHRDSLLKGFSTGGRDAAIAGSIWKPGSEGAASLRDYLRMSRGDPDALANAVDIAFANLRRNATKSDGSGLDKAKYDTWASSHKDSLDQLPPAERAKFESHAAAQASVDAVTADRARALDAFRTGAAKGMLEGVPAEEAIRRIFADKTRSPEAAMRELSDKLRSDPAAHDALKRDFIKHGVDDAQAKTKAEMAAGVPADRGAVERIISAVRGRHSDVNENSIKFMDHFNTFLRDNEKTVRELYGNDATANMLKITRHTGYKKPSHPIGRALATALVGAEAMGYGVLQHAIGKQPLLMGALAVGLGANTAIQKLRAAGITNVNDFLPTVMKNPQLVRDLAKKGVEDRGAWTRVMQQLAIIGTDEEIGRYGIGNPSGEEVRSKIHTPRFRTEPGYRQGIEGQLRVPHTPIPSPPRNPSPRPPLAR